jgi:phage terminase large subunit
MKDKLILLTNDADYNNSDEIIKKLADLDVNIDLKRIAEKGEVVAEKGEKLEKEEERKSNEIQKQKEEIKKIKDFPFEKLD